MRIAVVIHALRKGGAEAVTHGWLDVLTGAGHEVYVYTYGAGQEPGDGAAAPTAWTRRHADFVGRDKWRRLPAWIGRCLDVDEIDLVIAVLEFSNIMTLLATRRRRLPVVIVEHGIPTLLWSINGLSGRLKQALATRLYRRADAVVAVSHVVATDLRSNLGVLPQRLRVIPNVVDVERFRTAQALTSPRGKTDGNALRLVLVGRLSREKNFGAAIQAAARLMADGHATTVRIVGLGPERARLADEADRLGVAVEFAGWQDTWADTTASGDILVVSSSSEAFGNVLIEAAAAGIAAVAPSSALGVAEAMIPGVTGVLARSTSPRDLAAAVLSARDLATVSCPPAWLDRHTLDAVGPHVLSLVDDLHAERTARPHRDDSLPAGVS